MPERTIDFPCDEIAVVRHEMLGFFSFLKKHRLNLFARYYINR